MTHRLLRTSRERNLGSLGGLRPVSPTNNLLSIGAQQKNYEAGASGLSDESPRTTIELPRSFKQYYCSVKDKIGLTIKGSKPAAS